MGCPLKVVFKLLKKMLPDARGPLSLLVLQSSMKTLRKCFIKIARQKQLSGKIQAIFNWTVLILLTTTHTHLQHHQQLSPPSPSLTYIINHHHLFYPGLILLFRAKQYRSLWLHFNRNIPIFMLFYIFHQCVHQILSLLVVWLPSRCIIW